MCTRFFHRSSLDYYLAYRTLRCLNYSDRNKKKVKRSVDAYTEHVKRGVRITMRNSPEIRL